MRQRDELSVTFIPSTIRLSLIVDPVSRKLHHPALSRTGLLKPRLGTDLKLTTTHVCAPSSFFSAMVGFHLCFLFLLNQLSTLGSCKFKIYIPALPGSKKCLCIMSKWEQRWLLSFCMASYNWAHRYWIYFPCFTLCQWITLNVTGAFKYQSITCAFVSSSPKWNQMETALLRLIFTPQRNPKGFMSHLYPKKT